MFEEIFEKSVADEQKLHSYGFTKNGEVWQWQTPLLDTFTLFVTVTPQGVFQRLMDDATEEEYTLHLVDEANGAYVAEVRSAVRAALQDIANACFQRMYAPITQKFYEYVASEYGAAPEYLWEKYPTTAIWRHQSNQKWFVITMPVQRKKLGLQGEGEVQVVNVHLLPEQVTELVDESTMFRGYHMNKKTWLSMLLDGSVPWQTVCELLKVSYDLTK